MCAAVLYVCAWMWCAAAGCLSKALPLREGSNDAFLLRGLLAVSSTQQLGTSDLDPASHLQLAPLVPIDLM